MKNLPLALALSLSAGFAVAGELPELGSAQALTPSAYVFTVGLTAHNELYEEVVRGKKLMQEEAKMVGLAFGVARDFTSTDGSLELSLHYAQGNSTYTGSYWGGNYGDLKISGLDRTLFETELRYKHAAPEYNGFVPHIGLGYRHLTDRLDQAGPGGYKRENDRFYLAFGVERNFALTSNWSVTPSVQYKHLLFGQQHSDIFGGITHKQKKGSGVDVSVAFKQAHEHYQLALTPYYRTWDIADSRVVLNTYEPRNKTREVGMAVSMSF